MKSGHAGRQVSFYLNWISGGARTCPEIPLSVAGARSQSPNRNKHFSISQRALERGASYETYQSTVSMQKAAKKSETRRILISNESGLHARPVSELVRCAMRFKSEITIEANGKRCSAISIMDIMTADIRKGTEIAVRAEGVDADKALEAIEKCLKLLVDKGF